MSQSNNLKKLEIDKSFIENLPADPSKTNIARQVYSSAYSFVNPTKTSDPELICYSEEVAKELSLNKKDCESDDFVNLFSGNELLEGMTPYAMCYGGHQFGNWAGQLGDGRAINLSQIKIENGKTLTLQLKGAGPTPYSRMGDGYAVLRSSIREFLCSEAMHYLGIPTTRALSLISTGDEVLRDMFYDGRTEYEKGAVVCRVSPSFIRFGNFEIFMSRKDNENLKKLADFTIKNYYPHLGEPSKDVYLKWFQEICDLTCKMIVDWQRVGFVHGVMNTDNMSILGLTIDYGPYGWLEDYDPIWTPNTTDSHGKRYCFGNQAPISQWNLYKLANAIYPLVGETKGLEEILNSYYEDFDKKHNLMLSKKLGFEEYKETDKEIIDKLLELLPLVETDMTIFFRELANFKKNEENDFNLVSKSFYNLDKLSDSYKKRLNNWLISYKNRLNEDKTDDSTRKKKMNLINPKYVLRNYMAQMAIDKANEKDYSLVWELLNLLKNPYDEQPEMEKYYQKRPEWARNKAGCSMLSCSS